MGPPTLCSFVQWIEIDLPGSTQSLLVRLYEVLQQVHAFHLIATPYNDGIRYLAATLIIYRLGISSRTCSHIAK